MTIFELKPLVKRLQNLVERNKPSTIEFDDDNCCDLLNVQISVVYIDREFCEVVIYDDNGNRYHSKYGTSITIDNLYKICPVLKNSLFVCCKREKGKSLGDSLDNLDNYSYIRVLERNGLILGQHFIPDGWIHIYAGEGSRYFVKTEFE